jgi:hypothetical protein
MNTETFARKMILLSDKAKTHGKREFIGISDRLNTFLTRHESKMASCKGLIQILTAINTVELVSRQAINTP